MDVIKASEIGEFYYCCVAWSLRKKGVKTQTTKKIEEKLKNVKSPEEKVKYSYTISDFKVSIEFE